MPSSLFADSSAQGEVLQTALNQLSLLGLDNDENPCYDNQELWGRSVNMTECVPVPSSEHVAEIVGRQGCKIKALRAKTNSYIKTPVRGEEPVFVVTGRREDVAMARREIISAAEHFSMIRASRNKNTSLNGSSTPSTGPPNLPGETTILVRVPYRVVGLVVGPKGATIKRIQEQTHTYIVTPSRDKEPVFEVTGMPENVDRAREEIEAHITMRTGGVIELQDENDFHANGTDVGFDLHGHATLWSKPCAGITPNSLRKLFSNNCHNLSSSLGSVSTDSFFGNNSSRMANYIAPSPTLSYTTNNNGNDNNNNNNIDLKTNCNGLIDQNEVSSPDCTNLSFDSSSGFDTSTPPGLLWSQYDSGIAPSSAACSPPTSISVLFPTNTSTNSNGVVVSHSRVTGCTSQLGRLPSLQGPSLDPLAWRVRSDLGRGSTSFSAYPSNMASLPGSQLPRVLCDSSASSSSSSSTSSGTSRKGSRDCSMCFESEVIAALVPCGHNLFCMECANRICERNKPQCPVCHSRVTLAMRIFS
ncbi:RNA-binding protein MEX3B isoform X1 [Pungitius pungitius]|uniref:RNA-binding protein MEX3B isoform X1 n=1 Tax=Pungitius pungitius TaxID=134920 RepID=UPI002E0D8291